MSSSRGHLSRLDVHIASRIRPDHSDRFLNSTTDIVSYKVEVAHAGLYNTEGLGWLRLIIATAVAVNYESLNVVKSNRSVSTWLSLRVRSDDVAGYHVVCAIERINPPLGVLGAHVVVDDIVTVLPMADATDTALPVARQDIATEHRIHHVSAQIDAIPTVSDGDVAAP